MMRTLQYKGNVTALPTISVTIEQFLNRIDKNLKNITLEHCLLDSGSMITLGSEIFFSKFNFKIQILEKQLKITNAAQNSIGVVEKKIICNIKYGDVKIINAEIFLVKNVQISYPLILGIDILRGCRLNINEFDVQINNLHVYEEDDILKIFGDHTVCKMSCYDGCFDKSCGHEKILEKNAIHFLTKSNGYIEKSETVILPIFSSSTVDIKEILSKINYRFSKILKVEGFIFGENDFFGVKIKNLSVKKAIFVEKNTILLCAKRTQDIMYLECNHLIGYEDLEINEQRTHSEEFKTWAKNRTRIIEENDITHIIADVAKKAGIFSVDLKKLLVKHNWCISRNSTDIGYSKSFCEFEFNPNYDQTPFYRKPYPMDNCKSKAINKQLIELEKNGILQIANSSFNTAILGIKKPNSNDFRVVQDYSHGLNQIINLSTYPIPNTRATISNISNHLGKIKNVFGEKAFISTLDLRNGFYNIPVRANHRKFLSFSHLGVQYQFTRLAMGVKSAPSDFCFMMDEIFKKINNEKSLILTYIDDLIVISPESDAVQMIENVLETLSKHDLFIGLHKCRFFSNEVDFLGYKITCEKIEPITHKIVKLEEAKMPTNLAEAYKLAGIAAFYTRNIPNVQLLLAPLHNDIKKKKGFKLSDAAKKGIQELQKVAAKKFSNSHLNDELEIALISDASLSGIGIAIGNIYLNNDVISNVEISAYGSRPFDLQEKLLSSRARELIAAAYAFEYFQDLLRIDKTYILLSDHASLTSVFKGDSAMTPKTSTFTRLRKSVAILLEYKIRFFHISNNDPKIMLVDILSRNMNFTEQPVIIRESDVGFNIIIENDLSGKNLESNQIDLPAIPLPPLFTIDEIKKSQLGDTFYRKIFEHLEKIKSDESYFFNKKEYKLVKNLVHVVNTKNFLVTIIPDDIASKLLNFLHCSRDHCSIENLIFLVNKLNLHISSKYKQCNLAVSQCYFCQIVKPKNDESSLRKYSLRPALAPYESVRIDLMDFSNASDDFRYVLTFMDSFSLFLDIKFLKDKKALTIAREIILLSVKYNLSGRAEITSDSGREFDNKELQHALDSLNIVKLKISPHNPNSNRVERCHQECKRLLRNQLHKTDFDLKFKIELSVSNYNNLEQKNMNYQSPFKLLFAFEADHLSSVFNFCQNNQNNLDFQVEQKENISKDLEKWLQYHDSYTKKIGAQRFGNFVKAFEDLESSIESFSVGDIVATKFAPKVGTCAKFRFNWEAPFLIISKKLNSYRLECLYSKKIYVRNERLIKKLKLDKAFEQMLKKREYVVKDNYFYPVQTSESQFAIETDEILDLEKNREVQDEKRKLRNNKFY